MTDDTDRGRLFFYVLGLTTALPLAYLAFFVVYIASHA